MSMLYVNPAVVFWPFFKGRQDAIVPGATGAEDLAVLVDLVEPVNVGRPPVTPAMPTALEVPIGAASVQAGSGWRCTRPGESGTQWGGRVIVDVEWPVNSQGEMDTLREWLLGELVIGGSGGSLNSFVINVDGEDNMDSAVEIRAIDVPDGIEQLLERLYDFNGIFRFGPLRCEEVL